MAVTLISLIYITTVFGLYSSVKNQLDRAVDLKMQRSVEGWAEFIAGRPEGTSVERQLQIYPRRWLAVVCGPVIEFETATSGSELEIPGACPGGTLNLTETGCLKISSAGGGLTLETC